MSAADAHVPVATLLSHRDWVRRLARSMVRDDASADDVEQRTWLTALRAPPREAESARTWLARVVRTQVLNEARANGRRATHERAASRDESVRSAAEVVAEAETHKRLVVAVLALAEPYRSTVLLRFFEDAPPRVVAERMGVPVETVRTRVRRGLSMLRDDLSRGGGRDAWLAALAPIAGLRLEAGAVAGSSGATAAAVAGGALMTGKTTVLAVAVVLALATGYVGGRVAGAGAVAASEQEVAQLSERLAALESARPQQGERRTPATSARAAAAFDEIQAEQDRRIEALEAEVASLTKVTDEVARRAAAAGPAVDVDAELLRLQGLTTDQLLAEIRLLSRQTRQPTASRSDGEAVLRACGVAMARPLEPEQRAEALLHRAWGHSAMADAANEEASFREAIEVAGASSAQGRLAAAQLGHVASRNGDRRGAAEWFLGITRQQGVTARERSMYRYMAANLLAQTGDAGDRARARDEYRAVIDEFAESDDDFARKNAEGSRKALAALDRESGR